jgi:hypothetical protein
MCRHVYAPQQRVASPDSGSTTLLRFSSCYFVSRCIYVVFMMYFRFLSCVFCWFFVGFFTGVHPSTDPTELFVVLARQQCVCCFYLNRLFFEFVCIYNCLVRPWNRSGSYAIAYCLVLLDQIQNLLLILCCIYFLGLIVGVPTPFVVTVL